MRIVEYDADRRGDVADLMARVWGERPDEAELEWFYERNPVRPASVLLGEEDGRVVATVAISFQRMAIRGEEVEVGMPLRVATDPGYQGRGIFAELQAANEERVRELGVPLLLTVPNEASAPVFLRRLGWTPLPPLRVWARAKVLRGEPRARRVERFEPDRPVAWGGGDRVLRNGAWLNWRLADAPRDYTLLEGDGYAAVGRRGRIGVVAAVAGELLGDAAAVAHGSVLIAAPPPWERRRYLRAGYLPTPRTFTVLGKSLGAPAARRGRTSSSATWTFFEAVRVRDAAGRPGPPGARRDRAEAEGARGAARRARGDRRPRRPGRAAGELPRADLRRRLADRARPTLRTAPGRGSFAVISRSPCSCT